MDSNIPAILLAFLNQFLSLRYYIISPNDFTVLMNELRIAMRAKSRQWVISVWHCFTWSRLRTSLSLLWMKVFLNEWEFPPLNQFIMPLNEKLAAMNEFTLTMKKITTPLNGCMTALKKKVKPMIGCMGLWKMTTTKCLITNDRFQITNDKLEMINALWLIPMPKWPITNYKWGVRGNEILNSKLPTANRLQLKATSYTSAAAI